LAEKNQPFGPSFARDIEAILAVSQTHPGMFTESEIRASLEKAGMVMLPIREPDFTPPVPSYDEEEMDNE
jgi:hypothetical protein